MNRLEGNIQLEVPKTDKIIQLAKVWEGKLGYDLVEIDGRIEKLSDYEKFHMDFEAITKEEKILQQKFEVLLRQQSDNWDENLTIEVVRLLDGIYSTHLDNPTRFAIELHQLIEKGLLEEIQKEVAFPDKERRHAAECVDCIASISKDHQLLSNSAYSFATKFCNRIKPTRFPIYDSYVDFLLWSYIQKEENSNCKRKELKNYEKFIEIYDGLKKQWEIDESINYKDLDMFMWSYGKAVKKICKIKEKQEKGKKYFSEATGKYDSIEQEQNEVKQRLEMNIKKEQ